MFKRIVILLLCLLTAFGTASSLAEGVRVTDMCGREVTLDAPATRVVALDPSACDILCALDCEDLLVGRGKGIINPESISDVPDVPFPEEDAEIEEILALEPQVVFLNYMEQSREQWVKLLEENGATIPPQALGRAEQLRGEGCTLIFTAVDGRFAGLLALSDQLRESAAETIRSLKQTGVTPVLLTGDHENAARQVAKVLQIDRVHAGCLPEDKLNWIDHSQRQSCPVCMIGDGINDAPALKKAQVGIAMGGIGSDIAVDAADIALINDDIRELPHLVRLSRRMMLTIKCNLTFSMALNFIAIILAITGALNPVVGALVHNAGSVLVIVNSALLLKWKAAKS